MGLCRLGRKLYHKQVAVQSDVFNYYSPEEIVEWHFSY